ncbi:hypothetical protein [Paludisphaera mucosa]|uniref:Uncharacterized protein n=1 Tax=Paludisphaera mucosa TaxID=3030827 RepID=A0ABT6FA46_9BACT|nr:hypothetical protein [Paludisphaera mucosa]MDG3004309.1 hypothetical protein [Paludisphaera mucosa]
MTAQPNEAACLLEKGALYTRREGLQWDGRDLVFAGFKQGAFSLYFGDEPIYHFDLEGRWQRAYLRGRHYIKRLDGAVHEVERLREGGGLVIHRRTLDGAEARRLDEQIRGVAADLLADLGMERGRRLDPPDDKARPIGDVELREFLGRIAAWDADAWDAFEARCRRAYGPLPPLPPDCPNAVVVQATLGDRDGRSFAAGAVRDHAVRAPEEFEGHVRDVAGLLGRRLLQTRSVFLAGPDVLRLPGPDVLAYLDVVARVLKPERDGEAEAPAFDDVHAFLDDFQKPVVDAATLRAAYDRRLTRIALGVESGAPELRRLYGKDWSDADLQAFAADAKAAGIELSVMTLVGAGGRGRRAEHVSRTTRLIESLLLTRGDLVFLMDERELAGPSASRTFEPLDEAEWREQLELLRQGLSSLRERGVKVVPYSMVKQLA